MISPLISELPQPSDNKKGWPWTKATSERSVSTQSAFPRISIVTPSYNQGHFIEETIRSVLLQGYPNLEYIIIDGGSTDQSIEIIKKYEPWLTYWVSEPDQGQSHAINKGFSHASGDIYGWINSDDFYYPNAFHQLAQAVKKYPNAAAWSGLCGRQDDRDRLLPDLYPRPRPKQDLAHWWNRGFIPQPSTFFKGFLFKEIGGLNEHLHFAMDVDLWLRLSEHGPIQGLPEQRLACFREYAEAKTSRDVTRRDTEVLAAAIYNGVPEAAFQHLDSLLSYRLPYSHFALLFVRRTYKAIQNRLSPK